MHFSSIIKLIASEASWVPNKDGRYVIMVQARKSNSAKSFDYVSRAEYIIGEGEDKLIKNVYLDKSKLTVGEKLILTVEASTAPVVFRYWINENDNWELIKDYSADNNLIWTVKEAGVHEVLVECKTLDSKNKFDDLQKVTFQVEAIQRVEITDFKALSADMYVDNELIFQVEAAHGDKRMILYKFIKINGDGSSSCIQDYSTKSMVSFMESQAGDYKLLCLAKDMYSQMEYEDRALLRYSIKAYRKVEIKKFTTDVSSPQVCETAVTFKADANGGRQLLYRFRIDGSKGEDSGYSRNDTYVWKPKKQGEYKIQLWVKDISFEGTYEASDAISFIIEEKCNDPVVINQVVLDKGNKILKGEVVNINVIASGGSALRYSFIEKKDGKIQNKVDYGVCNWVNFTGSGSGSYEVEVRVKDKYSNKEYDSHSIVHIEVFSYIPAVIEHVLLPSRDNYIVGDAVSLTIITQNTRKTLLKYVLGINGDKVEETDFVKDKNYMFTPKCSGLYSVEIYAKNEESDKEFDVKREVRLKVQEALPVKNTKIHCEELSLKVNEGTSFNVTSSGGKDVLYQFYIMSKGDWTLVQEYSKKNYFSFIPFSKGNYRILALSKSSLKKCDYEDYDMVEVVVE